MSATLKIQGLSKKFGKQVVLDNINLEISLDTYTEYLVEMVQVKQLFVI